MFTPQTSSHTPNAISSQASVSGPMRFAAPDGQMIDLFGPVPVLANLSARQAKELGLMTSGTYGRTSSTSSSSAALQRSLESRLQAATRILGSTLYKMTWKAWDTGSGRSRFRLRASVLRTSVTASTGWPTPTAALADKGVRTFEGGLLEAMRNHGPDLAAAACLTGWGTPTASTPGGSPEQAIRRKEKHACGETELARIWTKVEAIRAKQAAKPKHSPLPEHAPQAQADARDALTPAARDVLAERERQITQEGYDPQHDDDHVNDEIAAMAALFIMPEGAREWDASSTSYGDTLGEAMLPCDWEMPNFDDDRRRQLVKGTAMGLAEIERYDRAAIAAAKGE